MRIFREEKSLPETAYVLFFIIPSINILGPADFPAKSDHFGDVDAERAIAARTEYATVPDDITNFFQGFPVNPPLFLVQLAD